MDAGQMELFDIASHLRMTVQDVKSLPVSEIIGWRAYLRERK